jgi:hypothetical protein
MSDMRLNDPATGWAGSTPELSARYPLRRLSAIRARIGTGVPAVRWSCTTTFGLWGSTFWASDSFCYQNYLGSMVLMQHQLEGLPLAG